MRIAPFLVSMGLALPVLAATPSNWVSPASGNWTDPTKWSTNPNYPTSGNPAGSSYDAIVAATGASYSVTLSNNVTLNSLTLNSPTATLTQNGGVLDELRPARDLHHD